VRIANFPDQQSAREYGRNLKWEGVIDDFYVTGYSDEGFRNGHGESGRAVIRGWSAHPITAWTDRAPHIGGQPGGKLRGRLKDSYRTVKLFRYCRIRASPEAARRAASGKEKTELFTAVAKRRWPDRQAEQQVDDLPLVKTKLFDVPAQDIDGVPAQRSMRIRARFNARLSLTQWRWRQPAAVQIR